MFRNYLKTAFRNIFRNRGFFLFNILGFTIGLSVVIIIGLYVYDDLTFDHYHTNKDRIFRLVNMDNTQNWISAVQAGPLMLILPTEIPEVEASTRMATFGVRFRRADIELPEDDDSFVIRRSCITGPGFFRVFDFKILSGEQEKPLENLQGVYLTQEAATAIFGEDDPLGKRLEINFVPDAYVAGIIEEPPRNSHLRFGAVIPLNTDVNPVWWDSWDNLALTGYLLLTENAVPAVVNEKIVEVAREHGLSEIFTPIMQPILDMHLNSNEFRYDAANLNKSSKEVVYGLMVIGILVLVIASMNFINLSSARSAKRALEVGLRKVIGAKKRELAIQFITESVLLTMLSMLFALALIEIILPYLDSFLQKELELDLFGKLWQFPMMMVFAATIGFISGIYPAFVISGFKPVKVLKGEFTNGKQGVLLRKILVISQFAISISLTAAVLIVLSQIRYMQKIDFGYDREGIMVIPAFDGNITQDSDPFRDKLDDLPFIISSGRVNNMPGRTLGTTEVSFDKRNDEIGAMFEELTIDDGFLSTLDVEILYGRNFSREFGTDTTAVLINETAYKLSGWNDPIGRKVIIRGADVIDTPWNVIGVIKDIHFGMAKRVIEPMVIKYNPRNCGLILLRIKEMDREENLSAIEQVYTELYPDGNFRQFYFDEIFSAQFFAERDFAVKVSVFASLAILVASLGLLGLSAFVTEQRTKEIGIRKVLGSSIRGVIFLLTKDFSKSVLIANIIAWPITFIAMNKWLNGFAYRTSLRIEIFVISGIFAFFIALITVSLQSLRAARANPVDSLKHE